MTKGFAGFDGEVAAHERQGYKVLAPAYPGFEVEVEARRDDPTPIAEATLPTIIEKLEGVLKEIA